MGVKKVAEADQEHEVFTFMIVTSFLVTGFLSGGDVTTPPKSLLKLLEKHNLNLNMPSEEEAKQLTSMFQSLLVYPWCLAVITSIGAFF